MKSFNEVTIMKNIQISVRHYFDVEDIKGLLDSASHGSSYWASSGLEYECETEKALTPTGSKLYDHEGEQNLVLTLGKIKKGLRIFAKEHPSHFSDFLRENYDMTTGDMFLQCCLFGEVIYG